MLQLLIVGGHIGSSVIDDRTVRTISATTTPKVETGALRQDPIMLQLVLQLRDILHDPLALALLLRLILGRDGAMEIVDRSCLCTTRQRRGPRGGAVRTHNDNGPSVAGRDVSE